MNLPLMMMLIALRKKDEQGNESSERWLIHTGLYDKPRNLVHNGDKRVIYDARYADF